MKPILSFLTRRVIPRLLLVACLGLLVTGCSSFNHAFQQASVQPVSPESPEGAWVGRWSSNKNGHHGELRCVVTHVDGDTYHARFKARYWDWFTFESLATLDMKHGGKEWTFSGDADLGWLAGGVYRYEGRVTDTFFFSEYHCEWDHGTFYMERPAAFP